MTRATGRPPRVAPRMRTESDAERGFATLIRWAGLPEPEREVQFAPPRKWRWDFAYPDRKLAIEIEGGAFVAGRHVQGATFERDCEKHSVAAVLGWRLIRVTPRHIEEGKAIEWLKAALENPALERGR